MVSLKTATAICLGAMLCAAQTINISGVVQDSAGVGIVGATVKLENADITTTTGADGSFVLNGAVGIKQVEQSQTMSSSPVTFHNGTINVSLCENSAVTVSVYSIAGRLVYDTKKIMSSGSHTITVPKQAEGIYLYRVNLGDKSYSFKASSFGSSLNGDAVLSMGASTTTRTSHQRGVIDDVIASTSLGMLDYRCVIWNSDTSGIVIKMIPNAGDVTDADGNIYQSVRIGNQVWTVENLRTTKYNDGTDIPHVTDSSEWWNLRTSGYCFYNNSTDAAYQEKWGALYNWYAVNTGKLAPAGWRVPTDADWTQLEKYLIENGYNYDGSTSVDRTGKSLAAKTDWPYSGQTGDVGNDPTSNNSTGFSALPGGNRGINGFNVQSNIGYWWNATKYDVSYAYYRFLHPNSELLTRNHSFKKSGFSVRLVRDLD